MGLPASRRARYEDLFGIPAHTVGEILNGNLIVSPRPAVPHALAASALGIDLGGAFQRGRGGPGGWGILYEPGLHLGDDVLVPDLAGWRKERMAALPQTAAIDLPPDWLCEVLSPSTEKLDRSQKLDAYATYGVPHVWLVNPLTQTLEVLRLESGKWLRIATFAGHERARAEPFEAIELELFALWGEDEQASP